MIPELFTLDGEAANMFNDDMETATMEADMFPEDQLTEADYWSGEPYYE